MSDEKPKTTLGQGFSKKPTPLKMQVDVGELEATIRRYEAVNARQKVALGRMAELLDQRTQDVHDHMRRANEAARWAADNVDDLTSVAMDADKRVNLAEDVRYHYEGDIRELTKLIPKDFDMYNEDDNDISMLAGYIKHMQHMVEVSRVNEVEAKREADRLAVELHETQQNLSQAITDARHNAKVANVAQKQAAIDLGDDTPPWLKTEPQTFVQPAVHEHEQVFSSEPRSDDTETLGWSGADKLMNPGEQRPGSF